MLAIDQQKRAHINIRVFFPCWVPNTYTIEFKISLSHTLSLANTHTHTYTNTDTHTHTHTHTHKHTHWKIYTHMHTHTHARTRTWTNNHTHTICTQVPFTDSDETIRESFSKCFRLWCLYKYICVQMDMYRCSCMCRSVYMYGFIYTYVCMNTHMHRSIWIYGICTYIYTHVYEHMYKYVSTYACIYTDRKSVV